MRSPQGGNVPVGMGWDWGGFKLSKRGGGPQGTTFLWDFVELKLVICDIYISATLYDKSIKWDLSILICLEGFAFIGRFFKRPPAKSIKFMSDDKTVLHKVGLESSLNRCGFDV